MKLIKLTDEHYVIVDENAEIKEGDWFIGSDNKILLCKKTILGLLYSENDYGRNKNGCKKITHSTNILTNGMGILYLSEVKELIGEVDVEKKYTEEDVIEFAEWIVKESLSKNKEGWTLPKIFNRRGTTKELLQFWKEQQLKTIWDVEFDSQGKLKLV